MIGPRPVMGIQLGRTFYLSSMSAKVLNFRRFLDRWFLRSELDDGETPLY